MAAAPGRRAVALAAVLLGVPLGLEGTALAGLVATGSGASAVGTGTWSAVATTATAAPYGTGPLALSFAKASKAAPPHYFDLVNTGTVALQRATYALTADPVVDAVLEVCSGGTWDLRRDTCSGTLVLLTGTGTATTTTYVPAEPGGKVPARVRLTTARPPATQVLVDVRVGPS